MSYESNLASLTVIELDIELRSMYSLQKESR